MKVSIDGLRRNLGEAYKKAVKGYRDVLEANGRDESFCELEEGLNELRQMIGGFMCMYSNNPDDEMTDMAGYADTLPWVDPEDEE